jgi:hypothetical protein
MAATIIDGIDPLDASDDRLQGARQLPGFAMRLLTFASVVFLAVVTGCASVGGRYDDGEHLAKTAEIKEPVFLSGTYVNWSSEERRYLYLQINLVRGVADQERTRAF